jgi:hypothetical protein
MNYMKLNQKNWMRLLMAVVMGVMVALQLNACDSRGNDDPDPGPDPSDPSEQIDIVGWAGLPGNSPSAMYQDMADAGFTINYAVDLCWTPEVVQNDPSRLFQSLATAAAKNIKLIVSYKILDYLSAENITRLKAHKGLAGYYFVDEPTTIASFAGWAEAVKKVQAIDKEHFCYINLLSAGGCPDTWAPDRGYCPGSPEPSPYRTYVQSFVSTVPVQVLSFDQYPIILDDNQQRTLRSACYYQLELWATEAKKANKPLWAFALASAHQDHPVPTLADLRLQVYSDLAYGAQCIQYYTYFKECFRTGEEATYIAPVECDHSVTPYGTGSIKTEAYYTIKEMNAEIKALSPVFKNAQMIWTAFTGTTPEGYGCTALDKSKLPEGVFSTLNITGNALVSLMEKGDNQYLVIVNRNVANPGVNTDITVQASGSSALQRVKKDATTTAVESAAQTVTPGDVIIYSWKKLSSTLQYRMSKNI